MTMRHRNWRARGGQILAIAGLWAVAAGVLVFILVHQGVRLPWERRYQVRADFVAAPGLRPGQGQILAVAGVRVGEVSSVRLVGGRARVTFDVDPGRLPAVYRDARMLIRPRTALADLVVEFDPGHASAGRLSAETPLSVAATQPAPAFDEVLGSLDADTRAYVTTLLASTGHGLRGRHRDLRSIFRALAPVTRDTSALAGSLARHRQEIQRLVGNLRLLTGAVAGRDRDLARAIRGSSVVFSTIGSENRALATSLERLPGALAAAKDGLISARQLATALPPTAAALRPLLRDAPRTLADARPLFSHTADLHSLRALIHVATPLAPPAAIALSDTAPLAASLTSVLGVLREATNELAHNPAGREEGFLFWLAWFAHNANSLVSTGDANGAIWRGQLIASCTTLAGLQHTLPALTPALALPACPKSHARAGR